MNLAIFLPGWIGDAVMATPALRALRNHFAGARILGVVKPYVAGVLEGGDWFDRLIPGQGVPAVAWQLRHESIDLAVLFPNSFRSALIARLGGCKRRIGFNRQGRGLLLTDRLEPARDKHGKPLPRPVVDDYNRLVELVGCPKPGHRLELFTTPRDEEAVDAVWRQARLAEYPEVIVLNPGAAFGSAKYWPAEYFAELAQTLVDRRGAGVLVLCGPEERELAQRIVMLSERSSVHSLADQPLSLGLSKACVRRCDLLVTTDSGPRHFGAAFDRPVITLFGPTHIAWTETYHPRAIHLQKSVPCGPCQQRVCPLNHRCMKELTPAEVFEAATQLRNVA